MKTIETTVYNFNELSESAKETAREWYRKGCLDYEWWDSTYENAERIGLKIEAFDCGRAGDIGGKFIESARECAEKILKEHGDTCDTFKTAEAFLKEREEAVNSAPRDLNGDFESEHSLDTKLDDIESDFLKSILEYYLNLLREKFKYIYTDESVDENILANDYTFTENGKREG